jgi:Rho-type GTPase-activating protein 1/2
MVGDRPYNWLRVALDYEGIYRKTGGSGQSKLITQLFERGDYAAFDLLDRDRFNDICGITSVLKSYFRSLPNPLLTFALHDEFIFASSIQDPAQRSAKYADLVKQLPTEHYYTLRSIMLHLYRFVCPPTFPFFFLARLADGVTFHSQDSRMPRGESDDGTQPRCHLWTYVSPCLCVFYFMAYATAATLMRSRNPAAEFSDMAGKALTIEWLVENAPTIFPPMSTSIWSFISLV